MTTSYVIPDSDDERIVEDDDENAMMALMSMQAKKRRVESNLQRWIKHLSALLTEEQRKVSIALLLVWNFLLTLHSTRRNAGDWRNLHRQTAS